MIENPTTFYLTRHGQTDWNVQRLMQGHTDIPLNETGEEQARELKDRLKDIKFDQVFSSDLLRAKRTAEIIALEHDLAVQATQALREGTMGNFEGTHADNFFPLFNRWVELTEEEKIRHEKHVDFKTVEPYESVISRFTTFLRETAIAFRGKNILIVTHGGVIGHFLGSLGYAPEHTISVSNGALVRVESDGIEFDLKEVEGIQTREHAN